MFLSGKPIEYCVACYLDGDLGDLNEIEELVNEESDLVVTA